MCCPPCYSYPVFPAFVALYQFVVDAVNSAFVVVGVVSLAVFVSQTMLISQTFSVYITGFVASIVLLPPYCVALAFAAYAVAGVVAAVFRLGLGLGLVID